MRRVVATGEMLIDFTALQADTLVQQAESFAKHPGGAPANVAVAVARLGQPAAFVGSVGEDPFGRYLTATLAEYGVATEHVFAVPGVATSLAFVARHRGDPDYFFVRNPGADVLLSPQLTERVELSAETILHFGSNSLAALPIREAIEELVQRAHACGALVSFDVNLRRAFWSARDEEIRSICQDMARRVDLLKVNREELLWLSGCSEVDTAMHSLARDTAAIIVCTLGDEGAALLTSSTTQVQYIAGFPVTCVDATGAGDACIGALLAQLLERGATRATLGAIAKMQWQEMVSYACAAAACNVMRTGAMNAMPTRAEIEQLLLAQAEKLEVNTYGDF